MRTPRALLLALALATPSFADHFVYIDEDGGGAGPRGFYDFDSDTGLSTLRVTLGGTQRFFGLCVQPATGRIFATDPVSNNVSSLWTIDLPTGTPTFIANINVPNETIADITFDPTTGVMYGMGRNTSNLYTIDPATAAATLIGTSDPNVRCGLCSGPTGTLYAYTTTGVLYRVDKVTAAATFVGGAPLPGVLVEDAELGPSGDLFFTSYFGTLWRTSLTTGLSSQVGDTGNGSGLIGIVVAPGATGCYANCDGSTATPVLNVNDFICFQSRFAAADSYANCDGSTTAPILNVNDFICFQTSYAQGCR
jgi:hypothetical protein